MAAVNEKLATAAAEAAEHKALASKLAQDNSCLQLERMALRESAAAQKNDAESRLSQLRADSSTHQQQFKDSQMKLVKAQRELRESKQCLKAFKKVSPS